MIEKINGRYRVKHEIGFYLYGNSEKEVLHKRAILENMKKGRYNMKLNK